MLKRKQMVKTKNEQGFASIVVALTIIVILSLITLAFAQLIRREQTNALNKQLSSQAFYAAESGINDAIKLIKTNDNTSSGIAAVTNTTNCKYFFTSSGGTLNNQVDPDASHNVSYTCLLINPQPGDLVFQGLGDTAQENTNGNSWTTTARTNPSTVSSMTIAWSSNVKKNGGTPQEKVDTGSNYPKFLKRDAWRAAGYVGVLKFSITPLGNLPASFSHDNLVGNTFTSFFYPTTTGAGTVGFTSAAGSQGQVVKALCTGDSSTSAKCQVTVNGLVSAGPYLLHIVSIYDASDIRITANGGAATFVDTQAVIDATGKAQDVLRRIQVRYPLQPNISLPSDALAASDICKRMEVSTTNTTFAGFDGSDVSGLVDPADSDYPCNLEN